MAPVGAPFAAAPPPAISLSPSCGPVGATVQVSGSSFVTGTDVLIIFDGTTVATVKGADIQAGTGTFTASFVVPTRATRGSPYTVTAQEGQGEFVIATASAPFMLPCPSLTLNPTCGRTGDPIAVHGEGFRSDLTVALTFTPPAGTAPVATAVPAVDSTFNASFKVPTDPPGTYVVTAIQLRSQATVRATFQIPCVKAAITLVPKVGPPGTVVTVTGTGFPIGAAVKLSWSQGIPIRMQSITIGSSQGFKVTVLIFWHDQLGLRHMDAGPDLSVTNAPLFNIATADFLVVPGSEQPRDFSWRR